MPLYEIQHSCPLTRQQKAELASQITHLHATAFTTPSLFVNINFTDIDATEQNYFIAGRPRIGGCNRITGMVRTSEKRVKEDFDTHAEKIEGIWNLVVRGIEPQAQAQTQKTTEHGDGRGKEHDKKRGELDETEKGREAKRLHAVFLYPVSAARERGVVIPMVSKTTAIYSHDPLTSFRRPSSSVSFHC